MTSPRFTHLAEAPERAIPAPDSRGIARAGLPASITLLSLLAGCGGRADIPVPNDASTRHVQIRGTADETLGLRVFTQYQSTIASCRQADNLFRRMDGQTRPQSVWVESPVQRTGRAYEARVALDHYLPGECGWRPFVIGFQVTNPEGLSTGQFIPLGGGRNRLEPGPENRIWVGAAAGAGGEAGSARDGHAARPVGAKEIRPMLLLCRQQEIRLARAISCVLDSPRELPLISLEAQAVQVDFRDLTAVPM